MMQQEKKYDYLFKLLLLGESKVGKTSILLQYTENKFIENQLGTMGVDFKKKFVIRGDIIICNQIWDTCGQDRYNSVTKTFFKGSQAIILVYSIDSKESFNKVNQWLEKIDQNASLNVIKILIANKCDLEEKRVVLYEKGKKLAEENKMKFFEVSAQSNTNIEVMFDTLIDDLLEANKKNPAPSKGKKLKNKTVRPHKKWWCYQ